MAVATKLLGIMAIGPGLAFKEKTFYRHMTLLGRKLGILVFVFSPKTVDFTTRTCIGYQYTQERGWIEKKFPLPGMVYDRYFVGPGHLRYRSVLDRLQNDPGIQFLGHGLAGKWQVHQMLQESPELSRFLPETHLFTSKAFYPFLKSKGSVVLKPVAGTHGRGVTQITEQKGVYLVRGRNQRNQPFRRTFKTIEGLKKFVRFTTMQRKHLFQPYLHLHTDTGIPFDIRILVQKNGQGNWQTTGRAVRVGNGESITSNLHGGGRAQPLASFLSRTFSSAKRSRIEADIEEISKLLPPFLEEKHGPLVELGIDIGVDRDGNVWLIEVNSRPGRTVFRQTADDKARIRSMTQPIKYAYYLMKERVGGT
ncbi:YheC/YheD family endospore coat-associated protein [Brevibacillus dissolubilis]|uniref:YheC/YheD family endospore coat-associated protein n=1 Tax=Brevibacillus dissolubilis TaxID=1844116 RepID=UPI001116C0F6|nr:YheC/YheD family protein [Brevibacillus dissolubilis]